MKERINSVLADVNEIKDLLEYFLSESEVQLSRLEVDVLKKKLIEVYEGVCHFEKEFADIRVVASSMAEPVQSDQHVPDQAPEEQPEEKSAEQLEEEPEEEQVSLTEEQPQVLGETFGKNDSLNEKMGLHNRKDVSARLQSSPIRDLAKSMGLNDRFIYTKELFSGNRLRFKETLDAINGMSSFQEANAYLSQFDWDENNPNVLDFKDKVKRRFL